MESYDLIILGGGISGLGVAREAARQKLSTALMEATTCGAATSNNTLRVIHGGFRYLQHGDLPRVVKSLCDQNALVHEAPDAVAPLACLMPLNRFGLKSRLPVTCAALLYGAIMRACRSPLKPPKVISASSIDATVPLLRGLAPYGALCWHDAVMREPDKVIERLRREILEGGGIIVEKTPAKKVAQCADGFEVTDALGVVRRARAVINTLGPWLPHIAVPPELAGPRPLWCKGFNVTISRQLDPTYAIGVEGAEGRLFFCVPRGSGTAIGTWYTPCSNDGSPPQVSDAEVELFLAAFNAALPGAYVLRSEVVGTDVGILPMESDSPHGPQLIGNERLHAAGRYLEVLSTKYTTFRSQARKALAAIRT